MICEEKGIAIVKSLITIYDIIIDYMVNKTSHFCRVEEYQRLVSLLLGQGFDIIVLKKKLIHMHRDMLVGISHASNLIASNTTPILL